MSRRAAAPSPVPAHAPGRHRVMDALAHSTLRERLVLALLLVERLTPREAASALDCPVEEVQSIHRTWIETLRATLRRRTGGRVSRALARVSVSMEARLRRAS